MSGADDTTSLERRARELGALNEIIKALTSTLDLAEILRVALERVKTLTYAEATSLLLYDKDRDELVFAATETLRDATGTEPPPERSIASWVARTGQSAIVEDSNRDPRCGPCAGAGEVEGRKNILAVPLKRNERVVGVIEVADRYGGRAFTDGDLAALERLASQIGASTDAALLSVDADGVRSVLAAIGTAVPSQATMLLLHDPEGRALVFSASRRLQSGAIDGLRLKLGQGIAGWVAQNRTPLNLEDASHDWRHEAIFESETGFVPRSMICVPVVSKDQLRGVIQVMNRLDGNPFDGDEFRLVQTFADYVAIGIENASLYRSAHAASLTDDLTGLANTRRLNSALPQLLTGDRIVSLIVLDFDNFKQVVDTHGHLIGSQTIGTIGKLIGRLVRPGDLAARFGGDEFVIALPDTDQETAIEVAERIRRAIESYEILEGTDISLAAVTASAGVATYPHHAGDADSLIRAADDAMYAAKRGGKNRIELTPGRS